MSPNTVKSNKSNVNKLSTLEALRTLNFLSFIPASPQIPPTTLLSELKKYPLALDYNRLFAVQTLMDAMFLIYDAELKKENAHEKLFTVGSLLEQLMIFPEISNAVSKYSDKNLDEYDFKRSNEGDFVKMIFKEGYSNLKKDNFVFSSPMSYEDIQQHIKNDTLSEKVMVSPEKIVAIYTLVTLIDVEFNISLNDGKADDETAELFRHASDLLERLGFLKESKAELKG